MRTMLLVAALLVAHAAAAQTDRLRFDGEIRLRGEWDDRTAATNADAATLARIRAGLLITAAPRVRGYVQWQDARLWGTEGNTLTDASADQLDLHQGWIELGTSGDGLAGRLGRQELSLGDERLVGAVGWTNTGRVFDGALLRYRRGSSDVRAFWMNTGERDAANATGLDPQANQGIRDDAWFLGAFGTTRFGALTLEGTLVHDRGGAADGSWTAAARVAGGPAPWRVDATAAYQFGSARRAYLLTGYVGHTLAAGAVGVQVDYLSGDDTPGIGTRKAFHTLYATNHKFYGFMDYLLTPGQLGEAGLIDVIARAAVPVAAWRGALDVHWFGTPQALGGSNALGAEADLTASRPLTEGTAFAAGVSVFRAGPGAVAALPAFAGGADGDLTTWAWAQLTLRW